MRRVDGAVAVCEWVGCSYRQLDYWSRRGLLGPGLDGLGSGGGRVFTPHQQEIAWGLTRLAGICGSVSRRGYDIYARAAAAIARDRVALGEVLLIAPDEVRQSSGVLLSAEWNRAAVILVPLRPVPDDPAERAATGAAASASTIERSA